MYMTIQTQFNEWVNKVYGGKGVTKVQREELRKSFFSGAFIMLNLNRELGAEPEDIAIRKLDLVSEELITQIQEWCKL